MINDLRNMILRIGRKRCIVLSLGVLILVPLLTFGYQFIYGNRILPGVRIGNTALGGLKTVEAKKRLNNAIQVFLKQGITLAIGDKQETIIPDEIDLTFNVNNSFEEAHAMSQNPIRSIIAIIKNKGFTIPLTYSVSNEHIAERLDDNTENTDTKKQDIRLNIENNTVTILTDTKPGYVMDKEKTKQQILSTIEHLSAAPIPVTHIADYPSVSTTSAEIAQKQAERIINKNIILTYDTRHFTLSTERIISWIISRPDNIELTVTIDKEKIATYITTIAQQINTPPSTPHIILENGKVVDFTLPKPGIALEEEKSINAIQALLLARRDNINNKEETSNMLALEVATDRMPEMTADFASLGIKEIIGKATTSLTGSPTNRIANIKNGVKFLTGILIKPGEEFSTITALGNIDNTTGYLPELVIRGDRTIPEFGGGLCQVSTTLFRAVMNAGLPVTERTNHSYRVTYYEKDGDGKYIGPGLDATIYMPRPDLRFLNDTQENIFINGYVKGTRVTFELYGTKDGRESFIVGPKLLTTTPPGDPVYTETDTLPIGEVKQIEKPHPGGSATATYTVKRSSEVIFEKIFKSFYKPWPARFLVGALKKQEEIAPISTNTEPITPTPAPGEVVAPIASPETSISQQNPSQ